MLSRRSFVAGMGTGFVASRAFADALAASDIKEAARDAWLFALPLIEVASLRARPNASDGRPAAINSLTHGRSLAGPASRAVTTPNNDTLYSNAFVDATKGPVRLVIPDCGQRYLSRSWTCTPTTTLSWVRVPRVGQPALGA